MCVQKSTACSHDNANKNHGSNSTCCEVIGRGEVRTWCVLSASESSSSLVEGQHPDEQCLMQHNITHQITTPIRTEIDTPIVLHGIPLNPASTSFALSFAPSVKLSNPSDISSDTSFRGVSVEGSSGVLSGAASVVLGVSGGGTSGGISDCFGTEGGLSGGGVGSAGDVSGGGTVGGSGSGVESDDVRGRSFVPKSAIS